MKSRHTTQEIERKMAKVFLILAVVLFAIIKASQAESCTFDDDCILHSFGEHCCEDGQCYSKGDTCPIVALAGGVIAAIVIGIIVFIAIVVTVIACCCCACCQTRSPGTIIVQQPPYQQFGVTTSSTTNTFNQVPQGYPQPYMQAPPQMKPL